MEAGELQLSLENVTEVGGNSRLWSTESEAVHLKRGKKILMVHQLQTFKSPRR